MRNLLYGYHPVREAILHRPGSVSKVLIGTRRRGERPERIEAMCRRHRFPVERVSEGRLDDLAAGVHNGFVAEVAGKPASQASSSGDRNLVVLLEDVQDPRNLGAILRVCEGAGVGRVMIRDRGSAPLSAVVAKTAAGANEWLDIDRIVNSAATIEQLKKEGFWVYGTDASGRPPWEIDLRGKVVICLGGESRGLRQRTRNMCDGLIGLPMRGAVDSLNVAAAAAAVIYDAVRQRLTDGGLPEAEDSG
jgi:23S rRNA (guanosine2251-2'-O)-methyltransferase